MKVVAKALSVLVVIALCASTVSAASPQYDITGVWRNAGGETFQIIQEHDQITAIYVNAGYAHRLEGRYYAPNKAKLVQIRRTRSTSCEMTMVIDITVNSATSVVANSTASESACGLTAGQNFTDLWARTQ